MNAEDALCCPVCGVVMVAPRAFRCGHTVCTPCSRLVDECGYSERRLAACPVCEAEDPTPWRTRPRVHALEALCEAEAGYPDDADSVVRETESAEEEGRGVDGWPPGSEMAEYQRRLRDFVRGQVRLVRVAVWRSVTSAVLPPSFCAVELHPDAGSIVHRVVSECVRETGAQCVRVVRGAAGETQVHVVWDAQRYNARGGEAQSSSSAVDTNLW